MRSFGRALQAFALFLLPLAMFLEMSGSLGRHGGLSDMLILMGFGIACFGIGRIIEGYGQ